MKTAAIHRVTHLAWQCLLALALILPQVVSARNPESTHSIRVFAGWNLLSLPASLANGSRAFLFPSAVSPAYIYQYPAGYLPQDTLRNGLGFWLKFDLPDSILIQGETVFKDTVEVSAGWNLIGSLSLPILVGSITTAPPGILASQFFGYVPGEGYQQADTLQPGMAYWAKVGESGFIVLSGPGDQPCPGIPTVDYAGRTYNTVQIGSQCWLRENLDVGTMVPGVQLQTDNGTIEKYCYNDSIAYCDRYGGLYQWNEAMQYSTTPGVQGICPLGWHIPTLADFQTLCTTAVGDGNALKAIGEGSGVGSGTNASGFSALLAGFLYENWVYNYLGYRANFWSSTAGGATAARSLHLYADYGGTGSIDGYKIDGYSIRCLKDEVYNLPPTSPSNPRPALGATDSSTSPTLRWSCTDPDGDVLTYDVYFSTNNPPVALVSSNQSDSSLMRTGLVQGTTYYWKVVAKDDHAHSTAGPVWNFTVQPGGGAPCAGITTVAYEGRTYHTVEIGNQCWFRENLDIGAMVLGAQGQTDNDTIEKYCYNNDPARCSAYGALYQWNEAMQYDTTQGAQGICPPGWHLPTVAEFQELRSTVGGDGNALKAIGQGTGDGAGTNTSGFSGLLAGFYDGAGGFTQFSYSGRFWSSTQSDPSVARDVGRRYLDAAVLFWYTVKERGSSVRCLKD